jgi:hypothetical protein
MATGDFLDIAQRACRLARRKPSIAAQITLAKEAVNEGYAQLLASSDEWGFLEREDSATLAAGTDTRTLAQFKTDFGVPASDDIEEIGNFTDDTNGRMLRPLSWAALEHLVQTTASVPTQGYPEFWALSEDRTIRFYPRPSSSVTLRAHYKIRGGLMTTDAAVPLIPPPHAAAILEHYAAWKLLLQDSGAEAVAMADRNFQIYERNVAILRTQQATTRMPIMGLVEPSAFYDLPDSEAGYAGLWL